MQNLSLTPLYQKKRELEVEIGKLAEIRDTEKRKSEEAIAAKIDLEKQLRVLNELIETIEKAGESAMDELVKIVTRALTTSESCIATIDGTMAMLGRLDSAMSEKIARIKKLDEDEKSRLSRIAQDNQKLDIRERDLQIYQERLQKKFDEVGLGKIIL